MQHWYPLLGDPEVKYFPTEKHSAQALRHTQRKISVLPVLFIGPTVLEQGATTEVALSGNFCS